jgi:hypothetical protein
MTKKIKELIEDDIMLPIVGVVTLAFYVAAILS